MAQRRLVPRWVQLWQRRGTASLPPLKPRREAVDLRRHCVRVIEVHNFVRAYLRQAAVTPGPSRPERDEHWLIPPALGLAAPADGAPAAEDTRRAVERTAHSAGVIHE